MLRAYDERGEKVMVPAAQAAAFEQAGGRVVSQEAELSERLEAEYTSKSLTQKALGAISPALPYPAQQALRASGAAVLPPTIEAYRRGAGAGFTAGLEGAATHEALKAVGGKAAADAYSKQQEELKAAHSTAYSLGEAAGMVGSTIATGGAGGLRGTTAKGLGRILPGAAIAEAGALAERGAARVVGGLATRGALGRAAATGTQFAARAGVEGALYSAASEVSEEVLGDKPLAAEKILMAAGTGFGIGAAAGGAMGFGGSLLASGARSAATGLSRMVSTAAAEEGGIAGRIRPAIESMADEQALRALGATKRVVTKATKSVDGGEQAVAGWVRRKILLSGENAADVGAVKAISEGRVDELLPRIQAEKMKAGAAIGDALKAHDVAVDLAPVYAKADELVSTLSKTGDTVSAGKLLASKAEDLRASLVNAGGDGQTAMLSDLYRQRAAFERSAHELARTDTAANKAVKEWLRDFDSQLVTKLDEQAAAMGKDGAASELRALKREYQLASSAEKMALDGEERLRGNNMVGLRAGITAGTAFVAGGPVAGIATAVGGHLLQTRGHAAAAVLLSKVEGMGAITKAVASVDELVGRAAKGAVNPQPIVRPAVSKATAMARAEKVAAVIREHQADPYRSASRIEERVSDVRRVAPQTADHVSAAMSRALAFLSSQVPPSSRRGQFETNKGRMSEEDARKLLRASEYASQPATILRDIGAGKIDRTTVEAAKALTPEVFAELQLRTLDQIQEAQAKGRPIPYKQRIKLSTLLDIPGDWTVAPKALAMLQMNASAGPDGEDNERPAKPSGRVELGTQQSTLDRIESR